VLVGERAECLQLHACIGVGWQRRLALARGQSSGALSDWRCARGAINCKTDVERTHALRIVALVNVLHT
jgi:hypothetical protein